MERTSPPLLSRVPVTATPPSFSCQLLVPGEMTVMSVCATSSLLSAASSGHAGEMIVMSVSAISTLPLSVMSLT